MSLVKRNKLRKIELILTDGKVHDKVHCVHEVIIMDGDEEVVRKNHRSVESLKNIKDLIEKAEIYIHPEEKLNI